MKDLVTLFEKAGCTNVKNYIQSGNVVFTAKPAVAKTISRRHRRKRSRSASRSRCRSSFGPSAEIRAVASSNPFLKAGIGRRAIARRLLEGSPDRGNSQNSRSKSIARRLARGERRGHFSLHHQRRQNENYQRVARLQIENGEHRTKLAHSAEASGDARRNVKEVTRG